MNETPNTTVNQSSPPPPLVTPVDQRYNGVRGWLKFLCFILVVINPLIAIGYLAKLWIDGFSHLNRVHGLLAFMMVGTLLIASVTVFGIYAGIGLWRIRPNAVKTAKQYFLCYLGCSIILTLLPFVVGIPSAAIDDMLAVVTQGLSKGIVYVAIWYSYLSRSKRVKATYEL
ncbi:MAG: DUF2569 family protein [bacterium]